MAERKERKKRGTRKGMANGGGRTEGKVAEWHRHEDVIEFIRFLRDGGGKSRGKVAMELVKY